jgi:hypothetical protein
MLNVDSASRVTILIVAVVLAVVWWGTNFADAAARRQRRAASAPPGKVDAESIGRTAGRLYARANDAVRKRS